MPRLTMDDSKSRDDQLETIDVPSKSTEIVMSSGGSLSVGTPGTPETPTETDDIRTPTITLTSPKFFAIKELI